MKSFDELKLIGKIIQQQIFKEQIMLDLNNKNVQIQISNDKKVWINIDNKCAMRITDVETVVVDDDRQQPKYKLSSRDPEDFKEMYGFEPGWINVGGETMWNKITGEIVIDGEKLYQKI